MLRNPTVTRLRIPVITPLFNVPANIVKGERKAKRVWTLPNRILYSANIVINPDFSHQIVRFVHCAEFHAAKGVDLRGVVGGFHPPVVARKTKHHAPAARTFEKHRILPSRQPGHKNRRAGGCRGPPTRPRGP